MPLFGVALAVVGIVWFMAPWMSVHWLKAAQLPAAVVAEAIDIMGLVLAARMMEQDYRGAIQVILINHAKETFTVTRGMRSAQMVLAEVVKAKLEAVDNLDGTCRGAGGFGHTGH